MPLKNKLDLNLKTALLNKQFKNYRVLIHCKSLYEVVEKKIKGFKGEVLRSIPSINCISANLSDRAIERLLEYPEIDYIIFDSYGYLCGSSISAANGVLFQERYKLTGKGIGVGLIDSGTYPHPDLMGSTSKITNFLDLVNGLKYPYDDNGHGTFIAGIICGNGKASKGMYRGVAENSHIFSIKCFNSLGKGYVSDILFSLETLINNAKEYNLKTLCLPFELTDNSYFILSLFEKLFKKAVENNLVIVVPSGTNGNDQSSMRGIATLENCITAGGIDTRGSQKIYEYSSSGPCGKLEKPDLVAACVDICSLNSNTEYISERNGIKLYTQTLEKPYVNFTGTSCSAAYVCGLCTLLFENNPNLTYKDVISLFKVSCEILPLLKRLQGMGTINLSKLLP